MALQLIALGACGLTLSKWDIGALQFLRSRIQDLSMRHVEVAVWGLVVWVFVLNLEFYGFRLRFRGVGCLDFRLRREFAKVRTLFWQRNVTCRV